MNDATYQQTVQDLVSGKGLPAAKAPEAGPDQPAAEATASAEEPGNGEKPADEPAAPATPPAPPADPDLENAAGALPQRVRIGGLSKDKQELVMKLVRNPDAPLDALIPRSQQAAPVVDAAKVPDSPAPGALPETVEATEALIKEMKAKRLQAATKDLNFEEAFVLDDKIDEAKDHVAALKQRSAQAEAESMTRFESTVNTSRAKAVELYPDVTKEDSELVRKMVEIDQELQETGNELYFSADKPLKVAQMAANELGLAPRSKKAAAPAAPAAPAVPKPTTAISPKAVSSIPVKSRPVQPVSPSARTSPNQPVNSSAANAMVDSVKTEEDFYSVVSQLKSRR